MQASPPANEEFMIAAYVVTAVIVLAYAFSLWRRARRWGGGGREQGAGNGEQ
jgi:hypothetical protein